MLIKLTDEKCRECGSKIRSEKRSDRHCNGDFNEELKFECGAVLKWSPNFRSEQGNVACPNSGYSKKRMDERRTALKTTANFVQKLDINEKDRENLKSHILNFYFGSL